MILDQEVWKNCANCGIDLDELRASGAKNASRIMLFCSRECRYECKEYKHWTDMVSRCHDLSRPGYSDYGARGITVCERWRFSFRLFREDLGPRPGDGYSLDRFPDNTGNYEPGNVRWATTAEQNQNRRSTIVDWAIVDQIRERFDLGEPVAKIARSLSLKYHCVYKIAHEMCWKEDQNG